jgi:hypothetical protein
MGFLMCCKRAPRERLAPPLMAHFEFKLTRYPKAKSFDTGLQRLLR